MEDTNKLEAAAGDNFSKQMQQTQAEADKVTASLNALYQKLGDVNKQRVIFAEGGKNSTKAYQALLSDIDNTTEQLTRLNTIIGQQERAQASAQNRTEIWSKAYDGATGKIKSMGEVLSNASAGFKPLADNIDKATKVISPFKDAITKANQAYTTYTESRASDKSRIDSLKDVFPELTKAVETSGGSMKMFKIALAETGIGLIVIAVAALMDKLRSLKPVMDMVNAVTASVGAVMDALGNSIVNAFTNPMEALKSFGNFVTGILVDPINTFKNLGKGIAKVADEAYQLSKAQSELKTSMSAQEIVNGKINDQIDLLKKQAENVKLSSAERIMALQQEHHQEEIYYNQNSLLAAKGMDNAIEEVRIKTGLNKTIIQDLKSRGIEAAIMLLKDKKINEEQFESIKKASDAIETLDKQRITNTQTNTDAIQKINDDDAQKAKERRDKAKEQRQQELGEIKAFNEEAEKLRADSINRMALNILTGYDREVAETRQHYAELLKKYDDYIEEYKKKAKGDPSYAKRHLKQYEDARAVVIQVKKEETQTLADITQKFQESDLQKLTEYSNQLNQIAANAGKNATELAIAQLTAEEKAKADIIEKAVQDSINRYSNLTDQLTAINNTGTREQLDELTKKRAAEAELQTKANKVKTDLAAKLTADIAKINEGANKEEAQKKKEDANAKDVDGINKAEQGGHHSKALELEINLLDKQHQQKITSEKLTEEQLYQINADYAKKKADLENQLVTSRIHAGDKFINAALAASKKDSAIYKAAFLAKKATSVADTIISTKQAVVESLKAYSGIPFIGQALGIAQAAFMAAQGASSIATIIKQKPGFAQGGQYVSDGRGALLSGYSRTDDTNAYLRSGEAVVVSEAMRNPWARNLVSAINVAHGGRDFSVNNPGKGYAIGGIFTDGGNANRYYSQPANDVKDLANTLAYQMINNFPPIYVDVKDVNSQQHILAQTVNRVNL